VISERFDTSTEKFFLFFTDQEREEHPANAVVRNECNVVVG